MRLIRRAIVDDNNLILRIIQVHQRFDIVHDIFLFIESRNDQRNRHQIVGIRVTQIIIRYFFISVSHNFYE